MKNINVSEFMTSDDGYKSYWKHENQNKNSIIPCEGLKVVERKILFAAKMLNLQTNKSVLTRKLAGDTGLYHISGEGTVQDTIKGMASTYKRQPQTCLLKGDGAFPTSASNTGAAARYTSIWATPLSRQIFEDIDFCPWVVDDTGVKQVEYISPPIPLVLIRGYKGIGVGKACYITERNYDEIYEWSRKIVDMAFPNKEGSGYGKRFLDAISKTGITSTEEIREFSDPNVFHDDVKNEDKIKKVKVPGPFNYMGAKVEYNEEKHSVMFYPKIDKEVEDRKTHYYITALPLESSDRIVMFNINKKFGEKVSSKCIDHSGNGEPLKLEIPKMIAEDESLWFGLRMKRGFTEAYCIWDNELDTVRVISYLYPILLDWYRVREEVVSRRLYKKASSNIKKIENNNLIKQYYDYKEAGKIKTEADVRKLFTDEQASYLIGLPERTYLKENVDKLQDENKRLESSISDIKRNIINIKDFIFNEWLDIGAKNKEFIEE